MKTGQADLPLHNGKAPRWLFGRMVKLVEPLSKIIIDEYGQDEFLRRLGDPYFFQSLGCLLGFDWHSSGVTTTTCGALKVALNKSEIGIQVAGGKGGTSRKAPSEIVEIGDKFNLNERKIDNLIRNSRLSAKVDSSLIQDKYNLYHHSFLVNERGKWTVIQQGMQDRNGYARRYHWISENIENMIENNKPIASMEKEEEVLNLTSKKSRENREISLDLVKDNHYNLRKYTKKGKIKKNQKRLGDFGINKFKMPSRHNIEKIDLGNFKALEKAYEMQPDNYEELINTKGMGPKTIRALSLISNLIYGSDVDWEDPAKYSFAHGGKDGYPEPVNKERYDKDIEILNQALEETKIEKKEKLKALKRMKKLV